MLIWLVLAYNEITVLKSSYVSFGRPIHPKTNSSLTSWFLVMEMVILFNSLAIYSIKLIVIYL
ncbi:MAG: hypothetical protein ACEY3L_14680, partial [Wolbachia sp.]